MTPRRLFTVAAGLTVLAGAIGVLRHQGERRRIRAGLGPPLGNAGFAPLRDGERSLSHTLAGWVPSRPASAIGRGAAALWAAPASALGLLAAASTGGRWRWDRQGGCIVVSGGERGVNRLQARLGFAANTLGHVVITRDREPSPVLLAHEIVHVRQTERLGVLLAPLYLWLMARWGYRHHPLERAARLGAERALREAASTDRRP